MTVHDDWIRHITAELDGELSMQERAALARHLVTCGACASARVSQLELRLALSRSAGQEPAQTAARPRPRARFRTRGLWVLLALVLAGAGGWVAHALWGGPLHGSVESSRAAFVVQ